MSSSSPPPPAHLRNVIIVGAGGQIGSQIVHHLLSEGNHKVTALTRPDSTSTMPSGLHAIRTANYDDPTDLAAAMTGQDVLIITMTATAPAEISMKLIDAAAAAPGGSIKYVVPNEWGTDRAQVQLGKDLMLAETQIKICEYIVSKGLKWISIGCGFWYEFSLAGTEERFGFDFEKRRVTFYDDDEEEEGRGLTKITTTTWTQTALAVARVLALPVTAPASTGTPSIAQFENTQILVSSFHVSQRDMFDSVVRVTGDKESDWTITHEGARDRFNRGKRMMQAGDFNGFTVAMYSRAFFPDDPMEHEAKVVNEVLGLPREELDEATRRAVGMVSGVSTGKV